MVYSAIGLVVVLAVIAIVVLADYLMRPKRQVVTPEEAAEISKRINDGL